jgi:hypothetical protein
MNKPLSNKKLQEIAQRAKGASPGPWQCDEEDSEFDENGNCLNEVNDICSCVQAYPSGIMIAEVVDNGKNRIFIAKARTDIPLLLNEIKRLKAKLNE